MVKVGRFSDQLQAAKFGQNDGRLIGGLLTSAGIMTFSHTSQAEQDPGLGGEEGPYGGQGWVRVCLMVGEWHLRHSDTQMSMRELKRS